MNEEEIGQMEARLHDIGIRVRDMMSGDDKTIAIEDMVGILLGMNERIKALEDMAQATRDINERVRAIEFLVGKLKCNIHE